LQATGIGATGHEALEALGAGWIAQAAHHLVTARRQHTFDHLARVGGLRGIDAFAVIGARVGRLSLLTLSVATLRLRASATVLGTRGPLHVLTDTIAAARICAARSAVLGAGLAGLLMLADTIAALSRCLTVFRVLVEIASAIPGAARIVEGTNVVVITGHAVFEGLGHAPELLGANVFGARVAVVTHDLFGDDAAAGVTDTRAHAAPCVSFTDRSIRQWDGGASLGALVTHRHMAATWAQQAEALAVVYARSLREIRSVNRVTALNQAFRRADRLATNQTHSDCGHHKPISLRVHLCLLFGSTSVRAAPTAGGG